ncbi:porin [Verticiella sediminum]|uniref:porin n=1 Tax=Verticiella sediminum TaxID=1247510 RepID=UPI0014788D86|nr:porin [Verticiella sediminum]
MNQATTLKLAGTTALITAAFAAPAHAAGSVTLYGLVDVGYQYQKFKGQDSTSGLTSGGQAASRWGLRGSEDLGNGLQANFTLENGFDITRGTASQNGRLFGRLAWAGLSGGWGELRLGRQTLAATDYTGAFSPFGTSFQLASGGQSINSNTTPRADSTVKYVSPTMSGLQATLSYSFNANLAQNSDGGGVAPSSRSDRVFSAAAHYKAAKWQLIGYYQGASLGRETSSGGSHADVSPREYGIGGSVELGVFTLHGGFAQHKDAYINGVASGNTGQTALFKGGKVNGYTLGVAVPVGTGTLLASFQLSDPNDSVVRSGQQAENQKVYSVGYTYPFSKRTNAYAYVSYLDGAWFDNAGTGVAADDWNATHFAVGLRHLF